MIYLTMNEPMKKWKTITGMNFKIYVITLLRYHNLHITGMFLTLRFFAYTSWNSKIFRKEIYDNIIQSYIIIGFT